MKPVHVECLPDELLVSKLGIPKKLITHHQGKSRVFYRLSKNSDQLAIVDEDPGSTKCKHEKSLTFKEEVEGIKYYTDLSGNKIFILKGKLEDWIISVCKKYDVKISSYGLPEEPNKLHDVINQRLSNFEKLLAWLIKNKNPALIKLKTFLND